MLGSDIACMRYSKVLLAGAQLGGRASTGSSRTFASSLSVRGQARERAHEYLPVVSHVLACINSSGSMGKRRTARRAVAEDAAPTEEKGNLNRTRITSACRAAAFHRNPKIDLTPMDVCCGFTGSTARPSGVETPEKVKRQKTDAQLSTADATGQAGKIPAKLCTGPPKEVLQQVGWGMKESKCSSYLTAADPSPSTPVAGAKRKAKRSFANAYTRRGEGFTALVEKLASGHTANLQGNGAPSASAVEDIEVVLEDEVSASQRSSLHIRAEQHSHHWR